MRLFLLLLTAGAVSAQAQLSWDQPTQRFERSPEAAEIEVQTDFPRDAPRAYTIHTRA